MGGGIKWREAVPEGAQILDLLDTDFKSTVLCAQRAKGKQENDG